MLDNPKFLKKDYPFAGIVSFQTEKGSIYTYHEDGRVSRFKTSKNEQHPPQDLVVFAKTDFEDDELIKDSYRPDRIDHNIKVFIIEAHQDGDSPIIENLQSIVDPGKLFLVITNIKSRELIFSKPVLLQPQIGLSVFEYSHDSENHEVHRHLGDKVVKINYENVSPIKSVETDSGLVNLAADLVVYSEMDKPTCENFSSFINNPSEVGVRGVFVLERQPDNSQKIITRRDQIKNPQNLYLGVVDLQTQKRILTAKASLEPTIGSTVYEYAVDAENNQESRKFGNRVTKINF